MVGLRGHGRSDCAQYLGTAEHSCSCMCTLTRTPSPLRPVPLPYIALFVYPGGVLGRVSQERIQATAVLHTTTPKPECPM
jgi:hypothetical protein